MRGLLFVESVFCFPHIFAVTGCLGVEMERERKGDSKGFGRPEKDGKKKKELRLVGWMKKGILAECLLLALFAALTFYQEQREALRESSSSRVLRIEDDYIKWVDFTVSYEALCQAYDWDMETHGTEHEIDWVELLAYTAARTGGEFGKDALKTMDRAAEKLSNGESTMEELTEDLKYYGYYKEAYDAAIGGLVGTPIMAIESGVVEALGWNQYGGWRIGIRSFDGKRYYYYAHLRQNYPYAEGLQEGSVVTAGDVIGYMGHTGYSAKENVNNIKIVHLHWGLQLIFDESQKEGNNEIWIDVYPLTRFLAKHTQAAVKVEGTKEWVRTADIVDPAVEEYEAGDSGKIRMPVQEDSLKRDELLEKQPETSESSES